MRTSNAEITVCDDIIVHIRFAPGTTVEAEHIDEVIEAIGELFGDRLHGNLIDVRDISYFGQSGRSRAAEQDKSTVAAVAVLTDSTLQRTIANLYMSVSRPRLPTKLFNSEASAKAWLLERYQQQSENA